MKLFYEGISETYDHLRESRSDSNTTENEVKRLYNTGYQYILNASNWYFLQASAVLKLPVTVLASDIVSGTKTISVQSNADFIAGQRICLCSQDNRMQLTEISDLSGSTGITLKDAVEYDMESGSGVYAYSAFLPHNCRTITRISTSGTSKTILDSYTEKDFLDKYTDYDCIAEPSIYIQGKLSSSKYQESFLYAGSGTSSTVVICDSLPSYRDEYFTGWILVNTTRKTTATIKSFSGTTKSFVTEEITGQTAGDGFLLIRAFKEIVLYPIPKQITKLNLSYIKNLPELVNDWDAVELPDGFDNLPALFSAGECLSRDDARKTDGQRKEALFLEGIERMRKQSFKKDKYINLKPVRRIG